MSGRALHALAACTGVAVLTAAALACNEVNRVPADLSEVALPGSAALELPEAHPARHPAHLVIVSIDTLRADHLSAYGYPRATSPAIDRLASEGVLFEQAYSQSPKTAESHMTIMTGLHPDAHGVRNWSERNERLSDQIPTLAELLKRAGYRTHGTVGGANVRAELGFDRGFDSYETAWGAAALFERGKQELDEIAAAEARGEGRPTFLFLHTFEPHDPYTPSAEYAARFVDPHYAGRIVYARDELRKLAGDGAWAQLQRAFWERVDEDDPADRQHLRDLYDALIRYTDDQLAGFLARMQELGLAERTLVVLLSDHGEAFGGHAGFRHNSVYQEVLHVPLVMRFPRGDGEPDARLVGLRVRAPVRLLDLMPTLLERLGVAVPAHVQGSSLLALIEGREERAPAPWIFSEWRHTKQAALRVDDWKYVRRGWHEELYDLAADAGEQHDLSWSERGVTARLRDDVARLGAAGRALHESAARGERFGLDADTRRELQSLGYLVEGQEN